LIQSCAIIGLGLIGGSIAKSIKKNKPEIEISAFDFDDVLDAAKSLNIIDKKLSKINEVLASELIIIALPVDESLKVFRELSKILKPNQILTDVCSVKNSFHKLWEQSNSEGIYIGMHPMSGKEKGGFENSDELLFENCILVVTDNLQNDTRKKEFAEFISYLGANILEIPAKQHDIIAASVSHLPQLVSIALVNTAALKTDNYHFLDLAAGGFRDMTRIASSDFSIWESIINENQNEILIALEKFAAEIEEMKENIKKKDYKLLKQKFNEANISRNEIPTNTKGFLTPLFNIYIFVKDEAGVLSKITTALFDKGINIKDIELLKIREGLGGNFRLSFASQKNADRAAEIISEIGFEVKH